MKSIKSMPAHARKVFTGEIFEVWQWDQELYDGTTAIFERLRRPDTVVVLPIAEQSVVVVEEQQPDTDLFLSIPSGRLEEGEDPLEGAKRELKEETGYESADWQLLKTVRPVSKIEWNVYVYLARGCIKTSEQNLDAGEKISVKQYSFDDFVELAQSDAFRATEITDMVLRARLAPEGIAALRAQFFKE